MVSSASRFPEVRDSACPRVLANSPCLYTSSLTPQHPHRTSLPAAGSVEPEVALRELLGSARKHVSTTLPQQSPRKVCNAMAMIDKAQATHRATILLCMFGTIAHAACSDGLPPEGRSSGGQPGLGDGLANGGTTSTPGDHTGSGGFAPATGGQPATGGAGVTCSALCQDVATRCAGTQTRTACEKALCTLVPSASCYSAVASAPCVEFDSGGGWVDACYPACAAAGTTCSNDTITSCTDLEGRLRSITQDCVGVCSLGNQTYTGVCGTEVGGQVLSTGATVCWCMDNSGRSNPANSVGLQEHGYYQMSAAYGGYCWTAADGAGTPAGTSAILPSCDTTGTCFSSAQGLCVWGAAARVRDSNSYAIDWGAVLGCNLNQGTGAASPVDGADLSTKTSLAVALSGTAIPSSLRVQLAVASADGETYYCAPLPSTTGGQVPLRSFRTECWTTGGTAFDPATMHPTSVALAIVTNTTSGTPFDFCVSGLSIL
jgi:hypothetical protein